MKKITNILHSYWYSLLVLIVYLLASLTLLDEYGLGIYIITLVAWFSHIIQVSVVDSYFEDYLKFSKGISPEPAKKRACWKVMLWPWPQRFFGPRYSSERKLIINNLSNNDFVETFKKSNKSMRYYVAPLGEISHLIFFILFLVKSNIVMYFVVIDILVFNLILFIINGVQQKKDKNLFEKFNLVD